MVFFLFCFFVFPEMFVSHVMFLLDVDVLVK